MTTRNSNGVECSRGNRRHGNRKCPEGVPPGLDVSTLVDIHPESFGPLRESHRRRCASVLRGRLIARLLSWSRQRQVWKIRGPAFSRKLSAPFSTLHFSWSTPHPFGVDGPRRVGCESVNETVDYRRCSPSTPRLVTRNGEVYPSSLGHRSCP